MLIDIALGWFTLNVVVVVLAIRRARRNRLPED
ncbi:hypothetical protein SAMN05216551_103126 [Chitinasiproducens palmae]|uniref:Uncharacterized protein n=1 Tax=Chitinasiproducens palmae TaxID=1770053 RepID=A0A1H2PM66_9BURK|nr:hypothetical protein SAMN05216551_103126 [Chitinasiproducens palmae]